LLIVDPQFRHIGHCRRELRGFLPAIAGQPWMIDITAVTQSRGRYDKLISSSTIGVTVRFATHYCVRRHAEQQQWNLTALRK
jgi:hypothetical protein